MGAMRADEKRSSSFRMLPVGSDCIWCRVLILCSKVQYPCNQTRNMHSPTSLKAP